MAPSQNTIKSPQAPDPGPTMPAGAKIAPTPAHPDFAPVKAGK